MKPKIGLVVSALVLLFAFAGIATAEDTALPTAAKLAEAVATPADCGDGEVDLIANLFAPPIVQMGYTNTCGACSVSQCRGATRGQSCWNSFERRWLWCIPTTGQFCSGTQDWNCQCAEYYF